MTEQKSKQTSDASFEKENEELNKETNLQNETVNMSEETETNEAEIDELSALKLSFEELNKSYLYLKADFENYRKRTLQEKANLIKTGGEAALTSLLPVVDDIERALGTINESQDAKAIVEGINLIHAKFMAYLSSQGVKPIEAIGEPFDTEFFDAITMIPSPSEDMKGKVIDCVQTGYMLYDKVIRHSKVVVGD